MYPMWIRIQYKGFGKKIGYTGSISSRVDLLKTLIRLDIQLPDIHSFIMNDQPQTTLVLTRLFQEVNKAKEEDDDLKQGKRPTNKQKQIIKSAGLQPDNWLVTKNLQQELHIVHRVSNKQRIISL